MADQYAKRIGDTWYENYFRRCEQCRKTFRTETPMLTRTRHYFHVDCWELPT